MKQASLPCSVSTLVRLVTAGVTIANADYPAVALYGESNKIVRIRHLASGPVLRCHVDHRYIPAVGKHRGLVGGKDELNGLLGCFHFGGDPPSFLVGDGLQGAGLVVDRPYQVTVPWHFL